MDQRHKNPKKTVGSSSLIAAFDATVEEDRLINIHTIARAHGPSYGSIHSILHKDLKLVKKSARWVPKLLSEAQMKERV